MLGWRVLEKGVSQVVAAMASQRLELSSVVDYSELQMSMLVDVLGFFFSLFFFGWVGESNHTWQSLNFYYY